MGRRLIVLTAVLAASLGIGIKAQEPAEREGNFEIRFEPTAKMQTGPPVPFQILVRNALHKPLAHAKVSLQIEDANGGEVQSFPAPETEAGTYIAKPVFHSSGQWTIYVEVVREGAKSARTIQFQVSN